MWALVKNGTVEKTYSRPIATTVNKVYYPKEMFTLYSTSEQKAIGIYPITLKSKPDSTLYDIGSSSYSYDAGTDTVSEDFTATEKNLSDLKATQIRNVQAQCHGRIARYDWLVTRYAWDNTKTIPSAVTTYTAAVRSHSNTISTAIDDCANFDAFKVVYAKMYESDGEYKTGWPDDSSVVSYER